jgi:hypothetical protein
MSKEIVEEVKREFKKISEQTEKLHQKTGFDKDLSQKIRKAGEQAHEVVKHIEKRQNSKEG